MNKLPSLKLYPWSYLMESHGVLVFINKWQLNSISSATGYKQTGFSFTNYMGNMKLEHKNCLY